jgi:FAD/FMN-containing dehydrogenase
MSEFDLTRILTGSEGTLAFITEARLDITRLPKVRRLVNVKYDSFDSALRNAPFMVKRRRCRWRPSTLKSSIWRAKISSGTRSAN